MARITPDPKNANKGTQRGRGLLERSLREYGAGRSVLADRNGVLIAGNKTAEVAAELDIPYRVIETDGHELIVVQRTDLDLTTDKAAVELGIADNRVGEASLEWDVDVLAELAAEDIDLSKFWNEDEIATLLGTPKPVADDPGAQVDRAAELQERWGTERGQLWAIGRHRLLCGDSTNADDVARLMDGQSIGGVFTSPPYDQQRTYENNMADDWHALMAGVFGALLPHLTSDAQVFVNLGLIHRDGRVIRYWDSFIAWMEGNDWPLFGWYVWDKIDGMPGDWSGRLAPAHEWLFHFAREGVQPGKTVQSKQAGWGRVGGTMRNPDGSQKRMTANGVAVNSHKIPDSVVRLYAQNPDELINEHPAPFPVELPAAFLEAWRGRLWYEPFAGSATTFVAAEQCGADVVGCEIEPKYVAVALERLTGLGLDARRLD